MTPTAYSATTARPGRGGSNSALNDNGSRFDSSWATILHLIQVKYGFANACQIHNLFCPIAFEMGLPHARFQNEPA
jgi:hypothetical protein